MAAFVNALNETLSATLSAAPTEDGWSLVTAWVMIPDTETQGSTNWAVKLADSTNGVWLAATSTSSRAIVGMATATGSGGVSANAGTASVNTWSLVGILLSPNTTGAKVKAYLGAASTSTSVTSSASTGRLLDQLIIGAQAASGSGSRWRGYIAEMAVWTPASEAAAADIMAEALTKKPSAITASAPIFYAPLESDATVSIGGVPLTVNGTTTFDAAQHPSLAGGGDTTAPTLTSPTGTATGSTTAAGSVSTDEANGTLYRLASTNATESAATVKAAALTTTVSATGVQSTGVTFSGLTASTTYYAHYLHSDAAGNDSAVVSSASFTTDAAGGTSINPGAGTITITGYAPVVSQTSGGAITTEPLKNNTGTLLASETGATVHVYETTGALVVTKTGQTTDASGIMTISDALIQPATEYRIVIVLGSGAEGMDRITSA